MKKTIILSVFMLIATNFMFAQKYFTKTGTIQFYSKAQLEEITATSKQVSAILDITTGDFQFKLLMKTFEFEKALMQEHFNEKYVESDKYPDATFKGKIVNLKDVNFTKDGKYNVTVEGDLTIHGVTKKVTQQGVLEIKDGKITATSTFNILLADYNVTIPNTVVNNISKTIEIRVNTVLVKLNK